MELAVDVRGLVKIYNEGKIRALDGIDFSVEAGKVFVLLGPNGAGKTTLMRILTTQFRPTSGEADIFGLDVAKDGGKVRKMISYVPQEMSVWSDISGYENLLTYAKIYGVPSKERKKIIRDAMETMGISEFANRLVKTYSGGMIRRLEIACALLIKPKILFLDEPTIGLDPSARKAVWEELMSFKKEHGVTIFFNTHYMEEADQYSDRIAIINGGKIVISGTAEELKHSLGKEAILLSMGAHVGGQVIRKIRKLAAVIETFADNSDLGVFVKDADSTLPKVMKILEKAGVEVNKVSITKPTLDDVFLKYAGTRMASVGRAMDVRQVRDRIRR